MKKFIIILAFFSPILVSARIRYVKATGGIITGTASTTGTAWTIGYALSSSGAVSGDTIWLLASGGYYNSSAKWVIKTGVSLKGDGRVGALGGTKIFVNYTSYTSVNDAFLDLTSASENTNGNQSISDIEFDGNAYTGEQCIMIKCRSNVVVHDIYVHSFNRCAIWFKGTASNNGAPVTYATGNLMYNDSLLDCSDRKAETTTSAGNISISGQSGLIIRNNYMANLNKPGGHNGNLFSSIQGHNKGLLIHDNIWLKPQNEQSYAAPSFMIESWSEDGGYEIYNNTFTGAANQIDAGTSGCVKGSYAYSWYIHDNLFQLTSQITYQPASIYNMGVQWEDSSSDVIVSNNTFKNLQEGIRLNQSHRAGDKDRNFQIHNNLFQNIGMTLAGGYGNYAIVLAVGKTGTSMRDIFIYNNTITASASNTLRAGIYIQADSGNVSNVRIIDNIITDCYYNGFLAIAGKSPSIVDSIYVQNNLVFSNTNSNNIANVGTRTLTHLFNTGNIIAAPSLASNYTLNPGSPAIAAGLDVGFGTDIGAFPFSLIAVTITWSDQNAIYGSSLAPTRTATSGGVPGTFSYNYSTTPSVGTHNDYTATFTPTDPTTYASAIKIVNLTISPIITVLTWSDQTAVFGASMAPTQTASSNGVPGTFAYNYNTTPAAGFYSDYTASFTPTDPSVYTSPSKVVNLVITSPMLIDPTITWSDQTVVQGASMTPTQTATSGGVLGSYVYNYLVTPVPGLYMDYTVIFNPTDTGTYNSATKIVNLTVTQPINTNRKIIRHNGIILAK